METKKMTIDKNKVKMNVTIKTPLSARKQQKTIVTPPKKNGKVEATKAEPPKANKPPVKAAVKVTSVKKPAEKKPAKPKAEKVNGKRDPTLGGAVWRSCLRLPSPTAKKLKKAADKNDMSINTLIETIIDVYLKEAN